LEVRGLDTWKVLRYSTKDINVHGELFDIALDHHVRHVDLIPLKYFDNVDVTPFVYHEMIGGWGQFPHHDQVPFSLESIYMKSMWYI